MKAFKETEKAIQLEMVFDFFNIERTFKRKVWIPKSQLKNGLPTGWIFNKKKEEEELNFSTNFGGCIAYLYDADGKEVETTDDERMRKGRENYERLVKLAKENGVKGVRVGLKRTTIEEKLNAAGVAF